MTFSPMTRVSARWTPFLAGCCCVLLLLPSLGVCFSHAGATVLATSSIFHVSFFSFQYSTVLTLALTRAMQCSRSVMVLEPMGWKTCGKCTLALMMVGGN